MKTSLQPAKLLKEQKNQDKVPTQAPILIDSDGEITNPILLNSDEEDTANPNTEDKEEEISQFQECEIEEINQAHDIINFVHASYNDNDSTDDGESSKNEPLELLWLIFHKSSFQKPPSPQH